MRQSLQLSLHFVALMLSLSVLLATGGCASTGDPDSRDNGAIIGAGSPTLVFQAGLGDDHHTWEALLSLLAPYYTLFIPDRPGSGNTPAVVGPRDPCTIAAEQHAALIKSGLKPPYILVGHSLGGLYQYAYASLYSEEVAGFVLIDPTHPRNWETIQEKLPVSAALLKGVKAVAFNEMRRREFDDQTLCLERPEFVHPPRVPGRVLIAGRPMDDDPKGFLALRLALAQEWPAITGVNNIDMVWDSAHYIHQEQPERVVAAIRQIASSEQCPTGCSTPPKSLDATTFDSTPDLKIIFGKTRREEIEAITGAPKEHYTDPSDPIISISVYRNKPQAAPSLVSFIPIVGDIVDLVEITSDFFFTWQELVVEYDQLGRVNKAGLRVIR